MLEWMPWIPSHDNASEICLGIRRENADGSDIQHHDSS
jgi:hypothetical protein